MNGSQCTPFALGINLLDLDTQPIDIGGRKDPRDPRPSDGRDPACVDQVLDPVDIVVS